MFHSFSQLVTIGRNTFIESIRQPIFTVLMIVAALVLVLGISVAAYSMDDDNKLMVDMGLSTLFVIGLFMAGFTATGVLSAEVENKTVLTVVSKPVARPVFVLGKFFGVAAAILLAYWAMTAMLLLCVRHGVLQVAGDRLDAPVVFFGLGGAGIAVILATWGNYFYHWVFTSTLMVSLAISQTIALLLVSFIDKDWRFQAFHIGDPQLLIGILLVFLGVLIITALAITASTRLGQIMTLVICIAAFVIGLCNDSFLANYKNGQHGRVWIAVYRVIPNIQMFWPADAITQQYKITGTYVLEAACYALLFVTAFLSLAIALFQTREVG